MVYLIILAGFVLLIIGGNYLVKGAVAIALRLNISKLIVGVVVVSIGTSLPELFVSVGAAIKGSSDIALSNVLGSNIANIALCLGVTSLFFKIPVKKESVIIDWPVMFIASMVLGVFMWNETISNLEGAFLLLLLIGYLYFIIRKERKNPEQSFTELNKEETKHTPFYLSLLFVIGGCTCLFFGSNFLIDNVRIIAKSMGVSERVIGLTVVAFGTSIPELTTSLVAAYRKESDILVGNIIGSNIFNILLVVGSAASLKVIQVSPKMNSFDIYWVIGLATLLLLTMLPAHKSKITRLKGGLLFFSYLIYLYFLL